MKETKSEMETEKLSSKTRKIKKNEKYEIANNA